MNVMPVDCQTTRHLIICSNFPSATVNKGSEEPATDQDWVELTVTLTGGHRGESFPRSKRMQGKQQELRFPENLLSP